MSKTSNTSKIDELNILDGENLVDSEEIYRDYFSIMPISDERKELRVQMSLAIEQMMLSVFAYMEADYLTDGFVDQEYYSQYLENEYIVLVKKFAENVFDDNYMNMYVATMSSMLVENTINHIETKYFTSQDRAINIAENESNRDINYSEEMEYISNGATMKTWVSVGDEKVRPTHREADGQTVSVFEPFIVGGCELMFPTDTSLGASWSEVDGCRCCAEYSDDNGNVIG